MMNMNTPSIAVGFARRQTPESSFGHFAGTEADLITRTAAAMDNAIAVNDAKTILRVPVAVEGFWSAIRLTEPGETLTTTFEPRRPGEEPVLRTIARGKKAPAKHVEIILYHRDALKAEASTDAEWEVVSINASPIEGPIPMDPTTMARNQLEKVGGTFQKLYSPQEWAEAAWFWSQYVSVQP